MYKAIIDNDTYISILEARHSQELYDLIDRSRESIGQWLEFPDNTKGVEDTEAFIKRSLNRFSDSNGYWAGIWHKGQIAGSIGFLHIDWNSKRTEIGYWLSSEFEGIGLMSKACESFVKHAFNDLNLRKIEIGVATNNIKSRAIPERLGFTKEGIIRSYEILHGQYLDRVIYGAIKEEWLAKSSIALQ